MSEDLSGMGHRRPIQESRNQPSEQGTQAMLFHHALDRLAVDAGFSSGLAHMAIMPLQELDQEASFERRDGRLFGMFEGSRFAGA